MARKVSNRRTVGKNSIQNVRVVDSDEGTDDVVVQRLLSAYNTSEGQIRVVCNYNGTLIPSGVTTGIVSFNEAVNTDDFISISQQYQEFRIRAIQYKIYDLQPSSAATINYWSTFHQIGGDVPVGVQDVVDRPDSRVIPPGEGRVMLAWVAHGIPEMSFQSTVTAATSYGGLSYYLSPSNVITGVKYSVIAKFIVDFRGRK